MKVLAAPAHYILNNSEGSEPYVSFKILEEVSKNHQVEYVAITGYSLIKKSSMSFELVNLYNGDVKIGNIDRLKFYYDAFKVAKSIMRKDEIDVIHHILPWGYEETFNLLALFGHTDNIPFIIGPVLYPQVFIGSDECFLGRYSKKTPKRSQILLQEISLRIASPVLKKLFKMTVEKADSVIAVNEATKKLYSKYVDEDKIKVIPHATNVDEFSYNFPASENPIVMFAGVLVERKGVKYLIMAFKEVLEEYPNARLKIFGRGPQKENLVELAKKLRIAKNIDFVGLAPREELIKSYESADVFVLPSLSEAFGMVLIEAMAAGTPCIASDIVGPNEIIKHGKQGFLFPLKDYKALAERIIELISDDTLRRTMSRNSRKIAEEKYDWKVVARQIYNMYKKIL